MKIWVFAIARSTKIVLSDTPDQQNIVHFAPDAVKIQRVVFPDASNATFSIVLSTFTRSDFLRTNFKLQTAFCKINEFLLKYKRLVHSQALLSSSVGFIFAYHYACSVNPFY